MYMLCTLLLVLYCYLEYTIHKHLLFTQNILVEQFTLIYSRSILRLKNLILVVQIFCTIYFTKCCVNIACMVPAWWFSNVTFVIFFGIFRSWSNEKHRCNYDSVIDIDRATAMFLSPPNRFQIFSSRFRLTGAQKKCTGIPRNYLDRLFHERIFICQKLSKSRQKFSTHRAPLESNILCSLSIYSLCLH